MRKLVRCGSFLTLSFISRVSVLHEVTPEPIPDPQEQGRMLQIKAPKQDNSFWERGQLAHGLAWHVLITGVSLVTNEQKAA